MRLNFLFLLGTLFISAYANGPVLVCRKDKLDGCKCETLKDEYNKLHLRVECYNRKNLISTNIVVPDEVLKGLDSVYVVFSNTSISQIISPVLSPQLSVKVISLIVEGHTIKKIDAKVFDELPKLMELQLTNNRIDEKILNSGWLTSKLGKTVDILDLSYNNLNKIQKESFQNLVSLREFRLAGNKITEMDSAFENLSQIEGLDLLGNKIQKITTISFGSLTHLERLYLDENQISQIANGSFSKLTNLKTLTLQRNNLSQIPSNICSQSNKLTSLFLNNNQIKSIQAHAFDGCYKLEELHLYDNQIEQISDSSFYGLERLKTILLSSNQIKQISVGTFKSLKKCRGINISRNRIERITRLTFDGLDSLRWLYLDENNIKTIENEVFDNLTNLTILTLNSNSGLVIGDKTFSFNTPNSLNELGLSRCALTTLPVGFLKNMPSLNSLDLRNNKFTSVPAALRNTKTLSRLDLSSNYISQIPANAFGNNPSLRELKLNNLTKLNNVGDCSFCGLISLEICSLNGNDNLKQINENAFGFLKNSVDKTSQISEIQIHDGGLKTIPPKLLPWEKIRISILGNPANCDPRMDWLFRNDKYNLDKHPTARYYDPNWCKQCQHDDVCQEVLKGTTTKSPMSNYVLI